MLIQVKKLKQENKSLQEKLGCKGSIIDKERMTDAIEKSSKAQIQRLTRFSHYWVSQDKILMSIVHGCVSMILCLRYNLS